MATSGKYKKTARQSRNLTVEDFFDKGIYMTDVAIGTGNSRNLVNLRINPGTRRLVSRGGLQKAKGVGVNTLTIHTNKSTYYPLRSDLLVTTLDNVYTFTTLAGFNIANTIKLPGIGGVKTLHTRAQDVQIIVDTNATKNLEVITPRRNGNSEAQIYFSEGPEGGINVIDNMETFKPLSTLLGCTLLNTFIGLKNNTAASGSNGYLYKYAITEAQDQSDVPPFTIEQQEITPLEVTASFAVKYGYNMLSQNPYTFTNESVPAGCVLHGMLPYVKQKGHWRLSTDYRTGNTVRFYPNWSFPTGATLGVVFEYRLASSDNWVQVSQRAVHSNKYTIAADPSDVEIWCELKIPNDAFQIKCTVYGVQSDAIDTNDVKCMEIFSFSGGKAEDTTTKPELVTYDLTTAQGILSWKRRVVLYGVTKAPNILFLSDIDTPSYFPYPNNIIEYDYPVLKVIEFLDKLLVFTTDGIYQTELGGDGASFITTQVVGNIHLTISDTYAILAIKNMLFYKSGNRYYMLVPSTRYGTTGDLQTAPISAPINYLLDNFEQEFRKLLQTLYAGFINNTDDELFINREKTKLTPTRYSAFIEGDLIKINHGFSIDYGGPAAIHLVYTLIYDTLNRVWLSDILELSDNRTINTYRQNILGLNQYILVSSNIEAAPSPDVEDETASVTRFTIVQYDSENILDFNFEDEIKNELPLRQFIDTGFRDIDASWKKRFRELQIKLSTKTDKAIYLRPLFYIDDELRKDSLRYALHSDAVLCFITRDEVYEVAYGAQYLENCEVTKASDDVVRPFPIIPTPEKDPKNTQPIGDLSFTPSNMQYGDSPDLFFRLGNEYLTDQHLNTVRFQITGKGYCPRLQLIIQSNVPYELHNISWAFRNMNAR